MTLFYELKLTRLTRSTPMMCCQLDIDSFWLKSWAEFRPSHLQKWRGVSGPRHPTPAGATSMILSVYDDPDVLTPCRACVYSQNHNTCTCALYMCLYTNKVQRGYKCLYLVFASSRPQVKVVVGDSHRSQWRALVGDVSAGMQLKY